MKKHWFASLMTLFFWWAAMPTEASTVSSLSLKNLRCEYKVNPLGIDALRPRLSWQILSDQRGAMQTAYQVQVAENAEVLIQEKTLLWDSGKVLSDASIHRVYEGPALQSGKRYHWRVRVWDGNDRPSAWSEPVFWEMGLLKASDWQASWIEPDPPEDKASSQPSPMLRTTFTLDGAVKSARAYVTALGLYEMEINGQRVGDQLLTPGWTAYQKRLQYQTYDVTRLLQSGKNVIGVTLGDGWYRGNLGFSGQRNTYGDKLALLLQLHVVDTAGRLKVVGTDKNWRSATGPIVASDLYMGETYDARLERAGWSQASYDDSQWRGVRIIDRRKEILVAPAGPPVRRIEEMKPVKILHTPAGETVFDMGQNMVGWIRLKVKGNAGTVVTLRHAEVLDQKGNFYVAN